MPTLAPMVEMASAEREARQNWNRNLASLRLNQPEVVELLDRVEPDDLQWVYARDGSLSALDHNAKWWGGCSVPLLAGRAILNTLENSPTGSCLLAPAHAGLVRAARERMGTSPVLFVIQPDLQIARMILACHDFSDQIRVHRFWFTCGSGWTEQMRLLLEQHEGLATPMRFIRTKWSSDELINPLISGAQDIFSAVLSDRSARLTKLQSETVASVTSRKILLIGGTDFRLWDDAASVLQQQLSAGGDAELSRFDTDDALNGAPLPLLQAASASGSVVSANLCRADCNQLVSTELPWITWITQPAVPAFETAGPRDALVLADGNWRAMSHRAGWPDDRVKVCGWPVLGRPIGSSVGRLAIICDTQPIEIPTSVQSFSSHKLLWELIEDELHTDPLAVEKIDDYLTDRAGQLNITVDALDRRSFVEGLIFPAYQQGLGRMLIAEKLPISLWGSGWMDLPEFTTFARGSVSNPEEMNAAIDASSAIIYCWPQRWVHAMDMLGKPIVSRSGRDRQQLIRNARRAVSGGPIKAPGLSKDETNLGQTILDLIGSI